MERAARRIVGSVSIVVAAQLASELLMRASWLLPDDFDPNAFLVRYGSGPLVGIGLLAVILAAFFLCRATLGRLAAPGLQLFTNVAQGVVVGLVSGAVIAWGLIRVDGMGNGGHTDIVRYQVGDFVKASLLGLGVFVAATLSVGLRRVSTTRSKAATHSLS